MTMQTLVRMQMLGMGAALLLASSGRAQQTMEPTSLYYAAPANETAKVVKMPLVEGNGSENVIATALGSGQATREESDLARAMVADAIMLAILMAGIAAIAIYATAATRRNKQLEPVLRDRLQRISYSPAPGATTH